jgi:hypothetical protein
MCVFLYSHCLKNLRFNRLNSHQPIDYVTMPTATSVLMAMRIWLRTIRLKNVVDLTRDVKLSIQCHYKLLSAFTSATAFKSV